MGGHQTLLSGTGASIMAGTQAFQGISPGSGPLGPEEKITINLEDVVLHEQKLSTILEVSGL